MSKKLKLSLVIPCYNEAGNVRNFYDACEETFKDSDKDIELVFVNDGSKDDTIKELNKLLTLKTFIKSKSCR